MPIERTIQVAGPSEAVWRKLTAYVDTGSDHCQIPADVAQAIGARFRRTETVLLANGREIEIQLVGIVLKFEEYVIDTNAIVGPVGGPSLLGRIALSQMGLGVDPVEERLIHRVVTLLATTGWPTV